MNEVAEKTDEKVIDLAAEEITEEREKALAVASPAPKSLAILPKKYEEIKFMARDIFSSGLAPHSYKSAEQVAVGIMAGLEINLPPMQALKHIAIVNGVPYLWGDAMIALVRSSGKAKYIKRYYDANTDAGVCETWRHGEPSKQVYRFTNEDAQKAKLLTKKGPWQDYPNRMKVWRATAWCLRDVYADVLGGMSTGYDLMDTPGYEAVEIGPDQFEIVNTTPDDPPDNPLEDNREIDDAPPRWSDGREAFIEWFTGKCESAQDKSQLSAVIASVKGQLEKLSDDEKAVLYEPYHKANDRLTEREPEF